jgi:hypothetical protein
MFLPFHLTFSGNCSYMKNNNNYCWFPFFLLCSPFSSCSGFEESCRTFETNLGFCASVVRLNGSSPTDSERFRFRSILSLTLSWNKWLVWRTIHKYGRFLSDKNVFLAISPVLRTILWNVRFLNFLVEVPQLNGIQRLVC